MLMSTDQCFRSGVVMWWGGRDWGWGDCSGSMRRLWWPQVTGGARRHLAELFWFLFLLHQDRDHSETRERPRKSPSNERERERKDRKRTSLDYADDRCEGEVKRRRSAEPQHSHSSSRINGDSDKHSKREQSRDRLDGHAKEEAAEDGPHKSKSKEKSKNKDKTRDKYPWQPSIKHFM